MYAAEFTVTYRIEQRYYRRREFQRVRRSLYAGEELLFVEDAPVESRKGALAEIIKQLDSLGCSTSDCTDCRYKIGDYRGDPGYLLYILFKTRLRLQLLNFKYRFFKFFGKNIFLKDESAPVE